MWHNIIKLPNPINFEKYKYAFDPDDNVYEFQNRDVYILIVNKKYAFYPKPRYYIYDLRVNSNYNTIIFPKWAVIPIERNNYLFFINDIDLLNLRNLSRCSKDNDFVFQYKNKLLYYNHNRKCHII